MNPKGRSDAAFRLAVVCYPTFGGSGVVAAELGRSLAARGHEVHIISTEMPARLRQVEGLTFHRVQVVSYPLFEYPPYTLALATKIADVIRREKLDLVHVHYAIPHSIAALLGQEMAARPVRIVTTLHGTDVQLIGLEPSYWEVTRYGMLRSAGTDERSPAPSPKPRPPSSAWTGRSGSYRISSTPASSAAAATRACGASWPVKTRRSFSTSPTSGRSSGPGRWWRSSGESRGPCRRGST